MRRGEAGLIRPEAVAVEPPIEATVDAVDGGVGGTTTFGAVEGGGGTTTVGATVEAVGITLGVVAVVFESIPVAIVAVELERAGGGGAIGSGGG